KNKKTQEPLMILTKRMPGGDYKLVDTKSTVSDFVNYYTYLHYQKALHKLGRIEQFEKQVKMPVLDYIAKIHEERIEFNKKNMPRKALITNAGAMCPNHCSVILNTSMKYCPDCGQAVIVGNEYQVKE
ncbi:MAG: hypothetical protein PUF50_08385, partial [Erysipelotrichaceae bacterium]|nr:hypothetical protein [Erysipelotrichaceae bacterium]